MSISCVSSSPVAGRCETCGGRRCLGGAGLVLCVLALLVYAAVVSAEEEYRASERSGRVADPCVFDRVLYR